MSEEEAAKPSSPTEIGRRSWVFIARKVTRGFLQDQCHDLAAGLSFYTLLALVPAILAGVSLVSIFGRREDAVQSIVDVASGLTSPETAEMLREPIQQLASSSVAGVALITGLLITVWSATRYVSALGRGMNRIYGVTEGRMLWKLKPQQLLVTLVALVLVVASVVLVVVSGPVARAIGDTVGLGDTAIIVWRVVRWPVLAFLVIFILAFLYYFAPNVKQPKFRWMSLGAAVAIVVLAIASALFALYVSQVADYDRVYGSLAGGIIFLLWLWIANMALLVGVEFDVEFERVRQLEAGIPAESQVQLPLRDASRIASVVRRDAAEEVEARRIRRER